MRKVTPSFPVTPSKNRNSVKLLPLRVFENLVGGSTPQQKVGWGAHHVRVLNSHELCCIITFVHKTCLIFLIRKMS